jgi:toxin ParE1/3/4
MAVKWTKTALANLVAIVEYIEKDNAERAKSFALEIQKKTNKLAEFPSMGHPPQRDYSAVPSGVRRNLWLALT